jgi:hypothetical protein
MTTYLSLAGAFSVTSCVLDARQKFPTGLTRTVYEGTDTTGVALQQRVTPDIDLAFIDDDPTLPTRFFVVRWEGVWFRPEDQWIDLYAGVDDEVVVKVDDRVVIDRNGPLGRGERMARFPLPAGTHRLEVTYRQEGSGYYLYVGVAEAGGVPSRVDPESLFPRPASARRIRVNRNLLLLRRAAVAAWVVPPLAALVWMALPWGIRGTRAAWRSWLGRVRGGWRLMSVPREVGSRGAPAPRRAIGALYLLTAVAFLLAIWQFREPQFGFTRLIAFGEQFQERVLPAVRALPHHVHAGSGYDGQFYAQLALDPLLRDPDLHVALDSVEYRARRVLLSGTAFVLGAGRPAWILEAYALQNVAFWLMLGAVLLRWLPPVNIRNWLAWCGCLLGFGSVASVTLALTDLPSTALVALGFAAAEIGRPYTAGGILGLSGLARETNMLAALGIDWVAMWKTKQRVRMIVTLLLIGLPLVLWISYLVFLLGPSAWSAGDSNLGLPFAGMALYLERSIRDLRFDGAGSPAVIGLVALFSTLVQVAFLAWRAELHRPWWRVGIAHAALMTLLGYPVWEGNPGASVRALLPMTVAYNVLIANSRWFWPLFVLGNLTMVQGLQSVSLWPW